MPLNEKVLKNITTAQKQILLFTTGALAVFAVFLLVIYFPTQSKLKRLQADLQEVDGLIQQIEGMLGEGTSMQEGIRSLEERFKTLDSKMPEREEEGLRLLSDLARKAELHVLSIKSNRKTVFLYGDKEELVVDGKKCHRVFVSMSMEGDYTHLLDYFQMLQKELPVYFTVEKLDLHKGTVGPKRLDINLNLSLYLLST